MNPLPADAKLISDRRRRNQFRNGRAIRASQVLVLGDHLDSATGNASDHGVNISQLLFPAIHCAALPIRPLMSKSAVSDSYGPTGHRDRRSRSGRPRALLAHDAGFRLRATPLGILQRHQSKGMVKVVERSVARAQTQVQTAQQGAPHPVVGGVDRIHQVPALRQKRGDGR